MALLKAALLWLPMAMVFWPNTVHCDVPLANDLKLVTSPPETALAPMAIELVDIAYALAPIAVAFWAIELLPSPIAMPPRESTPLPLTTLAFKPNAIPAVPLDKLFLPMAMASGLIAPSLL